MLGGFSRGLIIVLAACLVVVNGRAASFTASLDRDTITLGQQATLSLKFDGAHPQSAPTLPDVAGLQFQYVGPSSSFSFINGRTSSSITYNYIVSPQREGEFVIPRMRVDVNGRQFTSAPLTLTVARVAAPSAAAVRSGNEVAFMRLALPQQKVYAGQMLTAQLQIFLRNDVQNYGNPHFTSTPADGFVIGKSAGGQQYRTQIGNRIYTVIPISLALTVTKSGNLSLGPFTADMVVVLPSQNQNDNPFAQFGFNSPFFNNGQQKRVTLATEKVNVHSLPLPSANAPTNFNGAVGDYQMAVTAGPTNVAVGDPITVRVHISGRGAFDALNLPDWSGWNGFKLFPPTSKTAYSDQLDTEGDKTFEEIVTPQNADVHALPEISFSFFNPQDGKYHTLTQPPTPLVVRSASSTPLPNLAATQSANSGNQTPQDILPIKDGMGTLAQAGAPLIVRPVFLAAQSVPVLAFLAAFIWRKRADNLANNPRLRRRRAVAQLVASGMDDLKKYAAANQPDEFFATLFRLLQELLGERLDCPASSITENVIEEHPVLRGAPDNLLNGLRDLFQLCNQARYAPVRGTSELNSVAAKFATTAAELQNVKT